MRLTALLLALSITALTATPAAPVGAVPHERQLAWQRLEYYGFVHFGLNTFTDREWGYGDEDPGLFNPSSFDARTIVRQFKNAGMTGLVLTAKHHDGFCLWPTKSTPHNISKSPWKNGKGDLVREFADACKAENFRLGIYISPWDRNHPEYARDGYVSAFHQQIREIVSNYGPLFEFWFDGANGGDGYYGGAREKRNIPPGYYRFNEAAEIIRKHQPDCVIWGSIDARWGGSEQGHVNYPHWHTMDSKRSAKRGTGVPHGDRWMPAEGDTSIRPGWFWHQSEDTRVKSPGKLLQVWFDSVGRGANLILNVPPDSSGRIRQPDIDSLLGFKKLRDRLLATDFAAGTPGSELTDSNIETSWSPENAELPAATTITLVKPATFDVIRLREQIRLGQRVEAFAIDAWRNNAWIEIHAGQTIGNQVLARLPEPVTTKRLRLRVTACESLPCISGLSLFKMPDVRPTESSDPSGGLAKTGWKITNCPTGDASQAIDGNPQTLWHTHTGAGEQAPPRFFEVDLGRPVNIAAFTYLPRQDGVAHGITDRYRFDTSTDGRVWNSAAEGEFPNVRANPIRQTVPLKQPRTARHFRFTALRAVEKNHVSAAEIGVIPVDR